MDATLDTGILLNFSAHGMNEIMIMANAEERYQAMGLLSWRSVWLPYEQK